MCIGRLGFVFLRRRRRVRLKGLALRVGHGSSVIDLERPYLSAAHAADWSSPSPASTSTRNNDEANVPSAICRGSSCEQLKKFGR